MIFDVKFDRPATMGKASKTRRMNNNNTQDELVEHNSTGFARTIIISRAEEQLMNRGEMLLVLCYRQPQNGRPSLAGPVHSIFIYMYSKAADLVQI